MARYVPKPKVCDQPLCSDWDDCPFDKDARRCFADAMDDIEPEDICSPEDR